MKKITLCAALLFAFLAGSRALAATSDRLSIDSTHLYEGMSQTYEQGYVPSIADGKAIIVLPLTGRNIMRSVSVSADLGEAENSPFAFVNLNQTITGRAPYVFSLEIPLADGRVNGVYPVTLTAQYFDADILVEQQFSIYVTITDGIDQTGTSPGPELMISNCTIEPELLGGDTKFFVVIEVRNIGALTAKNVRLTYGGVDSSAIMPSQTNNIAFIGEIAPGACASARVLLKTVKAVLSGNHAFYLTLDYASPSGEALSATREFIAPVEQPARVSYDPISVPKSIHAGETLKLPANVFNTGKSMLYNVRVTATGAGLFPSGSVFLGDLAPGEGKYGTLEVFIGMLSMSDGYSEAYGKTNGAYTVSYSDEGGEAHTVAFNFSIEILKPLADGKDADKALTREPVFQWWISILVGFAITSILVAGVVTTKVVRAMRMG